MGKMLLESFTTQTRTAFWLNACLTHLLTKPITCLYLTTFSTALYYTKLCLVYCCLFLLYCYIHLRHLNVCFKVLNNQNVQPLLSKVSRWSVRHKEPSCSSELHFFTTRLYPIMHSLSLISLQNKSTSWNNAKQCNIITFSAVNSIF